MMNEPQMVGSNISSSSSSSGDPTVSRQQQEQDCITRHASITRRWRRRRCSHCRECLTILSRLFSPLFRSRRLHHVLHPVNHQPLALQAHTLTHSVETLVSCIRKFPRQTDIDACRQALPTPICTECASVRIRGCCVCDVFVCDFMTRRLVGC